MKSKNFFTPEEAAEVRFAEGLVAIQEFTDTLPVVSEKDKQGNKLYKSILSLLQIAIEVAPRLKNYLAGGFQLDNLVNNKATLESLQRKSAALETEKKRIDAAISAVRVHIDADYRKIYEAIKQATEDDTSLKSKRDELGAPYVKTSSSDAAPAAASKTIATTAA